MQPVDYIQFIVDCDIDTSGSNLLTCDSIRTLFAEYISSSPTVSLDHWLDSALNLDYSYSDYSMWIFNCAFDTLNTGLIPCDTLLKYRNAFYASGVPADSFVIWMNDTLFINYTYLQYAAWIANCDSTDSIPYQTGMSMRFAHNGSSVPASSSMTSTKIASTSKNHKPKIEVSKSREQIKAEFEKAINIRNSKLKAVGKLSNSNNVSPDQSKEDQPHNDTSSTYGNNKIEKRSGKVTSFLPEKFIKSLEGKNPIRNYLNTSTLGNENSNTFLASTNNEVVANMYSKKMGLSKQSAEFMFMPGSCGDLSDALIAYNSMPAGFHPPLTVWLNYYLDENLTYADYLTLISSCSLSLPTYTTDCDSIETYFSACIDMGTDLCIMHECLNSITGLDFTIHEYLQWFDSCNFAIIDCGDLASVIDEYTHIDASSSPPLTVYLQSYFNIRLTYDEWVTLMNNCSITIPPSVVGCSSLGDYYTECFNSNPATVTYCLNSALKLEFLWSEYKQWLDSCDIEYIDCEKIQNAIDEYLLLDDYQRPPLHIWLNSKLHLDFTKEQYEIISDPCDLELPEVLFCDSLHSAITICTGIPFNQIESCLDSSFQIDMTLHDYVLWSSECDEDLIPCDSMYAALSAYYALGTGVHPPLKDFFDNYFGLDLSLTDFTMLMAGCDHDALDLTDCDSIEDVYNACVSGVKPNEIADCINALTGLNFTMQDYWDWLDSCNINYPKINCDFLSLAVEDYPCWQDTITLTQWINNYLSLNETDIFYILYMDSCGIHPPCCNELSDVISSYPCFNTTTDFYSYLDSSMNVSLPDSFWIGLIDSCQISYPCDTCLWIGNIVANFQCQDTISLPQWLANETGWILTDSAWYVLIESCEIEIPCSITCEELQMLVVDYPCDSSITLAEWLTNETSFSYSDSTWLSMLDTCSVTLPCIPDCDSLSEIALQYSCASGLSIYEWLNQELNLHLTELEYQYAFDSCGITVINCCAYLDSIIGTYSCNDSLSLSEWLNIQTGWSLDDTAYIAMLQDCNIVWDTLCIPDCDSLHLLEKTYPCNSGIPIVAWLNDNLNVAFSDYEWEQILIDCPVDTMHCICNELDSLIPFYPSNDSLSLADWLNTETGWNFSDSLYLVYLDSCKIVWDTLFTDCDSLQLLQYSYPCNSSLSVGEWFNDQLNLSFTDLEWENILADCRIDIRCDSCALLDSLITLYLCDDTLSITEWLNQQTGWNKTDTQYISMLDSCDLYDEWQAHCDSCVADFTFTIDSLNCHRVHFVNLSNSSIADVTYHWDFGGSSFGDGDSVENPTIIYTTNDTFTVCLTITHRDILGNILCTDSICKDVITVSTPLVTITVDSATFCKGRSQVLVAHSSVFATTYQWSPGGSTNDSLTVSTAGTYSVIVGNGVCYASDIQVISVYDTLSPNITIIGSSNLCTGSTWSDLQADLNSYNSPASSWLWNTSETTDVITVYTAGTYCVTALDDHGCYVHACQEITETSPPDPPIIEPSGILTLCSGDGGFTVDGDSIHCVNYSDNLLWSTSETTQSIYVDYEDNFNVTYTDSNGCFSVSSTISSIINSYTIPPDSINSNHPGNISCGGVAVVLSEYGGILSSGINQANDQSYWAWYTGSCGGTLIDTGSSVTVYPVANTTYYLSSEGPCGSVCDSVLITVQVCDPCLVLDSLINLYPCNDTLSLAEWLNQQINWNLSDTDWMSVIDSCSLANSWITHCIPSCDSLHYIEHFFPCDSGISIYTWLNDTLNFSFSETEWDSIFSWCPVDTLCGLDSCEVLTHLYNEWKDAGSNGALETWLNSQLQLSYSYWDYLQMLDDCGVYIQIPCDTLDSLFAIYDPLPEIKLIFRLWTNNQLNLHYPNDEFNASLDSCNLIVPINCDTFRIYVDYFEAYHPSQNIIDWLNGIMGENYLLSDYIQWFDTCGPTPPLCDYYDSLYTYYTANADTVPLEQWFNGQTGLNYTYWQYVYLFRDCFPLRIPCDTLLYVWNAANNLPIPIPFYLYANNYWGLNYTPEWYCYLLDSCGIYSGPCDTSSCDSLQMLYTTYNSIIPQPDFTTWMNDTLDVNFTYMEYLQWFDTCIYLPVPCETLSSIYFQYKEKNITSPFDEWANSILNVNYSLSYYQLLLDSCNTVDKCDSLDYAVSAFLSQPDTSLDFTDFMNAYLGWTLTLEEYQSALYDCHHDTTLWLCDGGIVGPSGDSILTENCLDDFLELAYNNAQHNYNLYLDSLQGSFVDQYTSHCLNSLNEDFYVDGPLSEYHYTLHYYDQAGNLAQTIPPNGVVPFSDPDTLDDIAEFRSDPHGSSLPIRRTSTYATQYNYNTLNKPVGQHTPDADSSHFWYDRLGRLVFSQNAQQRIDTLMSLSYTVYDDLGRIAEVGKMDSLPFLAMTDAYSRDTAMVNFYLSYSDHKEVTHTYYDDIAFAPSPQFDQENLRNRVASVTWENINDNDSLTFDFATHYTYDISGNVKSILQETPLLESIGQSLKRIDYNYDLISGKVNYVYYQKDSVDQFIHHYEYDDDNRITHVYTSRDGMIWDEDAHYKYYLHGPLARVELGQNKVQGIDYAYTLQGWMKGINASTLYPDRDMGGDGQSLSDGFSRDAYGFSLGYFYQDYKPIENTANWQADYASSLFGDSSYGSAKNLGLYNGNIRHTVLSMDSMNYPNIGYVYQYDQLNRLKGMNAFADLDTAGNEWGTGTALNDYKELVDFDPNGNILNYIRRGTSTGGNTLDMDSMTYHYASGKNQLDHVSDGVSAGNYSVDIDDQVAANYAYDANGNLVKDSAEGITMTWWNNGKLKSVEKSSGDTLTFYYDVSGNRVMKKYFNNTSADTTTTVYIRDAQGNIMATYEWKNADSLRLKELDIYGSSRIGMLTEDSLLGCVGCGTISSTGSSTLYTGSKLYELTNHLGNVLATITDKKIYVDANADDTADYSVPEIASEQDYYPFGMLMPGRRLSLSNYRFGFNGKENNDELNGVGNAIDFGERIYDTRINRWLNIDPEFKKAPGWTSYRFGFNNPVQYSDKKGEFEIDQAFANKYPRTTIVLQNFDKLYNNQALPQELRDQLKGVDLQKIFNTKLRPELEKNSTLSNQEVQESISPGCGPIISSVDLDESSTKRVNGRTELEIDNDGKPIPDRNRSDLPGDQKGLINIDDNVAKVLEFELGGDVPGLGDKGISSKDRDKAFRVFSKTILHELVHYGRNKTGAGNPGGQSPDFGTVMEKKVFGDVEGRLKSEDMEPRGTIEKK